VTLFQVKVGTDEQRYSLLVREISARDAIGVVCHSMGLDRSLLRWRGNIADFALGVVTSEGYHRYFGRIYFEVSEAVISHGEQIAEAVKRGGP
jgi:hypothetical protein